MYMLVILIFVTSAYQHNIARASDLCGPPKKALNTEPVTGNYSLNSSIRIQCVAGYVRKVGTSNLIRCLKEHDKDKPSWTSALPLVCILEPSFARSKSTIGGVTSIFILCLAATLFILWWRSRRRDYTNVIVLQLTNQDAVYSDIPVSVIAPNPNNASIDSTAVIGTNHPQADSVQDSDSIHL
ncbi:interleukin-15 receptor subunit alpha isoform 10 precursor [Danio rerio]|uniref:Interleukin-15 receptor subunit alpha isoform 10 precursor n=1 Tax=Danio rerio TaxID=7955 RepID=A0AB13A914_DANRE|nr:interleukin-15 receptor subunit alpha isoform10 precursor [Danio rerio]ABO15458.1 interleukin 15 receptor alpha isoform 11 [Danio rerio]